MSGFPESESEIQAHLDALQQKIAAALADPDGHCDYRIGDRAVTRSQYLEWLSRERDYWRQKLAELPGEEINLYDDPAV